MNLKPITSAIISGSIIVVEIVANAIWDFIPFKDINKVSDVFKFSAFWIFVASIIVLVVLNIILNVANNKVKKRTKSEWNAALKKAGVLNIAAEEAGECIKKHDFDSYKKIVKLVDKLGL